MERIEDRHGDGVERYPAFEGSGGFRAFHDADDIAVTGTQFVVGNEGGLAGDGRGLGAGGVEVILINGIAKQPTTALERGVDDVDGGSADDLCDAHGVILRR